MYYACLQCGLKWRIPSQRWAATLTNTNGEGGSISSSSPTPTHAGNFVPFLDSKETFSTVNGTSTFSSGIPYVKHELMIPNKIYLVELGPLQYVTTRFGYIRMHSLIVKVSHFLRVTR